MGFKGIVTTLAVLAVTLVAGNAQADNRNTVYGYTRSDWGVMLSPNMGNNRIFHDDSVPFNEGITSNNARLGNEGTWGQIGWNLNLYTGDDKVTGNFHWMFTTWDLYGSGASLGHKEFYFDIKNLPGVDAEIWTGERDWLVNAVDLIDREYWNSSGVGAGITNLKVGGNMTLHFGVLRPDANGLHEVLQLRGIELFTGSSIDLGVAAAHTMLEETEGYTSGFSGHVRWTQNNILGGRNVLYAGIGTGALANSKNFRGTYGDAPSMFLNSEDGLHFLALDDLQIKPMPELTLSFVLLGEHEEHNSKTVDLGGIRNTLQFGARLNYDVSKYVALMLDGSYDYVKVHVADAATLIKITPAVQLNVAQGNVPRIRLYATYASWNDEAQGAFIADENSAITAGIAGEAWF